MRPMKSTKAQKTMGCTFGIKEILPLYDCCKLLKNGTGKMV